MQAKGGKAARRPEARRDPEGEQPSDPRPWPPILDLRSAKRIKAKAFLSRQKCQKEPCWKKGQRSASHRRHQAKRQPTL